jgi:AraC-like DNA-binding protein
MAMSTGGHTGGLDAALIVTRGESATGWWEMVRRRPDPRLASLVIGLCGYRERSQATVARTMPASTRVPLILSFGDAIEVDMSGPQGGRHVSFVGGLYPGPATTRYRGGQFGVQVDLTPLGAFRLCGVPGSALADQVIDLGEVAPALGPGFQDRLGSLANWEDRFALVDDVLCTLAAAGPEPDPMVGWVWRQLADSGGAVRVSDLVAETGRSHRHVTSRFRDHVGLTPKAAAGVLRFERAAAAVRERAWPLAAIAAEFGYADQSHLTREFVRLAGQPPASFAARPAPLA